VAIVLVDPSGVVVRAEAFRRDDFGDKRSPQGRFVSTMDLVFRAEMGGAYSLFMKSVYYAFNIRASSHPWIASMHYPGGQDYTRVDYPECLFIQTEADAAEASIQITCTPMNRPARIAILNLGGRTLAEGAIQGAPKSQRRGSLTLQFAPRIADGQIVQMRFESPRPMRDVNLYPTEGFTPWIGASPEAPFPTRPPRGDALR